MKKLFITLVCILAVLFTLAACDDSLVPKELEVFGDIITAGEVELGTDLTGLKARILYTNGSYSQEVEVTAGMISGYNKNTAGSQQVTVTYEDISKSFTIVVLDIITFDSIAVFGNPAVLEYNQDLPQMTVKKVFSDGSSSGPVAVAQSMISGFSKTTVGEQTVTITYEGKVTTFKVTVANAVVSIEVTDNKAGIYLYNSALDITVREVSADGTKAVITSGFTTNYKATVLGAQKVTVTHTAKGFTASFDITVENYIESIEVTDNKAGKYTYNSALDITVREVSADGTKAVITSGFTTNYKATALGAQKVTVTHTAKGFTATFDITVENYVASIEVTDNKAGKYQYNSALDITVREVSADGTKAVITSGYTTNYKATALGAQKVTVTHTAKGYTEAFDITVENYVASIEVTDNKAGIYDYGEALDITVREVNADNTKVVIATGYTTDHSATATGKQTVTVTHTAKGFTDTVTITVATPDEVAALISDIFAIPNLSGAAAMYGAIEAVDKANSDYSKLSVLYQGLVTNYNVLQEKNAVMAKLVVIYDNATFKAAFAAQSDGQVFYIKSGIYMPTGKVTVDKSVTVYGESGAVVNMTYGYSGINDAVFELKADGILFENMTVNAFGKSAAIIVMATNKDLSNIKIIGNSLNYEKNGIAVFSTSRAYSVSVTIEDNIIRASDSVDAHKLYVTNGIRIGDTDVNINISAVLNRNVVSNNDFHLPYDISVGIMIHTAGDITVGDTIYSKSLTRAQGMVLLNALLGQTSDNQTDVIVSHFGKETEIAYPVVKEFSLSIDPLFYSGLTVQRNTALYSGYYMNGVSYQVVYEHSPYASQTIGIHLSAVFSSDGSKAGGAALNTALLGKKELVIEWWDGTIQKFDFHVIEGTAISGAAFFDNLTNFNYSGTYTLISDIDLSASSFEGFKTTFKGKFYGCGYMITMKKIVAEDAEFYGLFQRIDNAIIDNLRLTGSYETDKAYIGMLAGHVGHSTITNVQTFGEIIVNLSVPSKFTASGLVEYALSSTISDCVSNVVITVDGNNVVPADSNYGYIAGIAAEVNSSTISDCVNNGAITVIDFQDNLFIGGIVAYSKPNFSAVLIKDCVNNGDITVTNCGYAEIGGIVGMVYYEVGDGVTTYINDCTNDGDITAGGVYVYVGGIAGCLYDGHYWAGLHTVTISGCVNGGALQISFTWDGAAADIYSWSNKDSNP